MERHPTAIYTHRHALTHTYIHINTHSNISFQLVSQANAFAKYKNVASKTQHTHTKTHSQNASRNKCQMECNNEKPIEESNTTTIEQMSC